MAASKTTKKRKRKPAAKQQPVGNRFQTEILILVMFAACLILMISAFGMGGIVGNAISAVCFGIMGLCAYIFPILLFAGVTFLIVNNTNRLAYKKVLAGVVFFVFLCGFLQLITEGYTPSTTFSDYYSLSSEYRTGGGSIRWCSMYFHSIRFWRCGRNCDHRSGASCVSDHHNTEILLRIYE